MTCLSIYHFCAGPLLSQLTLLNLVTPPYHDLHHGISVLTPMKRFFVSLSVFRFLFLPLSASRVPFLGFEAMLPPTLFFFRPVFRLSHFSAPQRCSVWCYHLRGVWGCLPPRVVLIRLDLPQVTRADAAFLSCHFRPPLDLGGCCAFSCFAIPSLWSSLLIF